ncbi:MAG: replicative helicase, partial [Chloroflexota bacterium]|nr:replicative helicase [Chloroflexota bacterium]
MTGGTKSGTAATTKADEAWSLDTGAGTMAPRTALEVLADVRAKVATGELADYEPIPLGMAPLDRMLGGGIRPGELMLIGGAQGTGKTTLALQMARNVAASGQAYVLYVNFEHDDADMLNRLISLESVLPHLPNTKPSTGAVKITDVRSEVIRSWARAGDEEIDLSKNP